MLHNFSIEFYKMLDIAVPATGDKLYEFINAKAKKEVITNEDFLPILSINQTRLKKYPKIRVGDVFYDTNDKIFFVASFYKQALDSKGIKGFGFFPVTVEKLLDIKTNESLIKENTLIELDLMIMYTRLTYIGNLYLNKDFINNLIIDYLDKVSMRRLDLILKNDIFFQYNKFVLYLACDSNWSQHIATFVNLPMEFNDEHYIKTTVKDFVKGVSNFSINNNVLKPNRIFNVLTNTMPGDILELNKDDFERKTEQVNVKEGKYMHKSDFSIYEYLTLRMNDIGKLELFSVNHQLPIDHELVNELALYNFDIKVHKICLTNETYKNLLLKSL